MDTARPSVWDAAVRSSVAVRVLVATVLLAAPAPAGAAFPGGDGPIDFASFADPAGELSRVELDGSNPRALPGGVAGGEFATAPDGRRVAFIEGDDVWILDADSGQKTQLTTTAANEADPSWTPDGTSLIFTSRVGDQYTIDRMQDDGGNRATVLTPPNETAIYDPALSPDASRIAFTFYDPSIGGFRVRVVAPGAAFGDSVVVGPESISDPDWSPDGSLLVVTRLSQIVVVAPVAGSVASPVGTLTGVSGAQPVFSPSGTRIAFSGPTPAGGPPQIRMATLDADGAWTGNETVTDLTNIANYGAVRPSWVRTAAPAPSPGATPGPGASPTPGPVGGGTAPIPPPLPRLYDGPIFIASDRDDPRGEIYSFTLGGEVRRLTDRPGVDRDPDVSLPRQGSPSQVAFTRNISNRWEIWTMATDGSGARRFAGQLTPDARDPDWSPSGQRIAYVGRAAPGARPRIYLSSPDGAVRTVGSPPADASDEDPVWSPDGTQVAWRRTEPDPGGLLQRRLCTSRLDVPGSESCSVSAQELRGRGLDVCADTTRNGCSHYNTIIGALASRGLPSWGGPDTVWATAGASSGDPVFGVQLNTSDILEYRLYRDNASLLRVPFPGPGALESLDPQPSVRSMRRPISAVVSPTGSDALITASRSGEDRMSFVGVGADGRLAAVRFRSAPALQVIGLPSWSAVGGRPSAASRGVFGSGAARVAAQGLRLRGGRLRATIVNRERFIVRGELRVRRAAGASAAASTRCLGTKKSFTLAPGRRVTLSLKAPRGRSTACLRVVDQAGRAKRVLRRTIRPR